jgi:uncharacterized glyoxalase superfamily protein PhnB
VDGVDAEERRLRRAGLEIVLPLVTEPWGQRRFQVAAPDGVVVEVVQMAEHPRSGAPSTSAEP